MSKRMSKIIRADFKKKLAYVLLDEDHTKWFKINPGNINVRYNNGSFQFNITKVRGKEGYIIELTKEKAEELFIRKHKKKK